MTSSALTDTDRAVVQLTSAYGTSLASRLRTTPFRISSMNSSSSLVTWNGGSLSWSGFRLGSSSRSSTAPSPWDCMRAASPNKRPEGPVARSLI